MWIRRWDNCRICYKWYSSQVSNLYMYIVFRFAVILDALVNNKKALPHGYYQCHFLRYDIPCWQINWIFDFWLLHYISILKRSPQWPQLNLKTMQTNPAIVPHHSNRMWLHTKLNWQATWRPTAMSKWWSWSLIMPIRHWKYCTTLFCWSLEERMKPKGEQEGTEKVHELSRTSIGI